MRAAASSAAAATTASGKSGQVGLVVDYQLEGIRFGQGIVAILNREHGQLLVDFAQGILGRLGEEGAGPYEIFVVVLEHFHLFGVETLVFAVVIYRFDTLEQLVVE